MPSNFAPTVWRFSAVAAICTSVFAAPGLMAQTSFTYQGQLKSGGNAINGTADVRFTLYTALSGGSIVGAPIDVLGASVTNGLISTPLNFGALAFDGSPRWLEIAVRSPAGGGAYTTLTPRQAVNPAPYAMYALNSNSPFVPSGANAVYTGAGNVGIGRSSPLYKLDVSAGVGQGIRLGLDGNGGGNLLLLNNTGDNKIYIEGYNSTNNGSAAEMLFTGHAGGLIPRITLRASTLAAEGQVGVGGSFAVHPDYRMHVKATTLNGLLVESAGASYALVGINTGGGNGVYGSSSGANSRGGQFWTNNGYCAASGDHTGGGTYGLLGTANEGIYGNGGALGKIGITGVAGGGSSGIVGSHVGSSTGAAGLFGNSLASSGNGIIGEANTGTAAYGVWGRATQGIGGFFSGGTYAIVAAGKARVNTIEIIGGSDLAEPFDVAQVDEEGSMRDIQPGMVVVIDPANPGALKISTSANDRKVAGIVSGANDLAPGMIMTSEGGEFVDGDHPVALTGRVWCWCDSATGAIEPGDMLTTSDTAGHAMKAAEHSAAHGTIIGKAMTPLAQGKRGLVLVLVNLQ